MTIKLKTFLFAIVPLAFGFNAVSAQTTAADLEGTWILNNLLLPGEAPLDPIDQRLRIPLQGLPMDAESGEREGSIQFEILQILLSGDNTFSGNTIASSDFFDEFSGEFVITEDGLLDVIEVDDEEGTEANNLFAINEGRSLMIGVGRNTISTRGTRRNFGVDFDIITRAPDTVTHADIAGTWIWQDSFIEDVFGNFQFDPEFEIVISSDGTGVAKTPDEGDISFNVLFGDNGKLIADFGDGDSESFYINATKDVFVRINRDEREDFNPEHVPPQWGTIETEYEYMAGVAVRQPESLELADLVGTWNLFIMVNDIEWFATDPFAQDGGESNPDFKPFGRFAESDAEQLRVVVKEPKTETSTTAPVEITLVVPEFNNAGAKGTKLLGEVGIVNNRPAFTVNVDGRAETIPFAINASKDFIIRYEYEPAPAVNGNRVYDVLVGVKRSEEDLGIWERTTGAAPQSWLRIPWFGNVYLLGATSGWVFHQEHGWVFIRGRSLDGFWIFFPGLSTPSSPGGISLWTNQALYPNFLRVNPDVTSGPLTGFSFVSYARSYYQETGELWFYDFATASWIAATPVKPGSDTANIP